MLYEERKTKKHVKKQDVLNYNKTPRTSNLLIKSAELQKKYAGLKLAFLTILD